MKIKELIEDMASIEIHLSRFEKRFGVKSSDFFKAMNAGELEEFDALDEYRMDFIEWLALYKTWLSLDESCQNHYAKRDSARPRGNEFPRYCASSLQDWNCKNMSCKDIVK